MNLLIKIRDLYNRSRIYLILFVIVIGTISTMLVQFIDPSINERWYKALYHTFQFFLLSATFPISGPWYAYYTLLVLYFLIPLMTVGYISTILKNVFNTLTFSTKKIYKFKNHVVIAGAGKTGEFLSRQFAHQSGFQYAIVIDNNEQLIRKNLFLDRKIKYLLDDISRTAGIQKDMHPKSKFNISFVEKANIRDAKLFIAITGDDFANLDAAILLKESSLKEIPHCFIQISDSHLYKTLIDRQSRLFSTRADKIHIINSYEIVAEQVVTPILDKRRNEGSKKETLYIIAGFGNFGKMIYEQIVTQHKIHSFENSSICIIDTKSDIDDEIYFSSIGHDLSIFRKGEITSGDNLVVTYEESDIRKRTTWEKIFSNHSEKSIIVIIATDNDTMNLSAAMRIQNILDQNTQIQNREVKIVCRFFRNPRALIDNPYVTACTFSENFHEGLMKRIQSDCK